MTAASPKATGRPEVAVVALIVDRRRRILLTQRERPPAAGQWHTPGGGLEFAETFADALIREIREEIGVEVVLSARTPAAITQMVYPDVHRHVVALHFRARIARGTPRPLDGTRDVRFFTEAETRALWRERTLLEASKLAIEHALGWRLG
jgi:ADP-ribose pyrophosphatase YjhB (NUDIX family)